MLYVLFDLYNKGMAMKNFKPQFFLFLLIFSSGIIHARSAVYVSNQLFNRTMQGRVSYQGSTYKEFGPLKQYESQKIGTIDNQNMLSQLKIDIKAGPSKSVTSFSNKEIRLNNILSGNFLAKAQQLVVQNKDVYLNIQEHPGSQQAGVNVLSVPIKAQEEEEELEDFQMI